MLVTGLQTERSNSFAGWYALSWKIAQRAESTCGMQSLATALLFDATSLEGGVLKSSWARALGRRGSDPHQMPEEDPGSSTWLHVGAA